MKKIFNVLSALTTRGRNEAYRKCSVALCPWKAKYTFLSIDGIAVDYECWFHGGMIPWLNIIWDFMFYYPRLLWNNIRYDHRKQEMNPYFIIKELIEYHQGE